MKKRLITMFVFAMFIVAIPLWANINGDNGYDNDEGHHAYFGTGGSESGGIDTIGEATGDDGLFLGGHLGRHGIGDRLGIDDRFGADDNPDIDDRFGADDSPDIDDRFGAGDSPNIDDRLGEGDSPDIDDRFGEDDSTDIDDRLDADGGIEIADCYDADGDIEIIDCIGMDGGLGAGGGITTIGLDYPMLTFDIYGYGTIRATSAHYGDLLPGSRITPGTVVIFQATGIDGEGFEFLGWRINGVPYGALLSQTFSIEIEEDTHVRAVFDHPWAATATHHANAQTQNDDDEDDDDNEDDDDDPPVYFAVVFELGGGTMPSGVQSLQSLRQGSVIDPLPVPSRYGYTFGGWQSGGNPVTAPLTINSDMALTAAWAQSSQAGQYMAVFNPAPGTFANANETGLRPGNYGDVITDMPQAPTRAGYIFGGWRLPGGSTLSGQLTISGDVVLTAVWAVNPAASPSPSPSPSPTPTTTPRPGGAATSPNNPQTSPLQVSFMIFGFVLIAGISAYSITKITRKQLADQGQYHAELARFNREQRIVEIVDGVDDFDSIDSDDGIDDTNLHN